ncbi:MAG: acyl-CoA thioesterase, partial [Desulfobacterales bacterium]|nr:acyl-CoA thioesterase [Desulfobacterales bacterium]
YYPDPMWIQTRPSALARGRLRVDYVVTQRETGAIICKGFTRHRATNAAGKPVGVDEKTKQLWENFPK